MAERYAVGTGNWSDTATWDGGTLPATTDDVYANNFTVTIDSNRTAASVRNTAGTTAVAGGSFTLPNGVTLTANVICGPAICVNTAVTTTAAIVGDITGSATTASVNGAVNKSGAGTLTTTGTITGGSQASAYGAFQTAGAWVHVGNIVGGSATNAMGLRHTPVTGSVTVTGNVTAGTGTSANGIYTGGQAPITINGTIIGNARGGGGGQGLAWAVDGDGSGANAPVITVTAAQDGANGMAAYRCPIKFQASSTAEHTVQITGGGGSVTLQAPTGTHPVIGCSFIRGAAA